MNRNLLPIVLLVGLGFVLYFVGSSRTGFQGTDELRYSQIAKELAPGADLFLLHFNGERYSDKPPPYFWSIGLSFELFGFSPSSARIPGNLSAIGCAVATYLIALALFGRPSLAFWAGFTLLISPRFLWIGRWVRLDVVMCLFVYLSMLSFARSYFVTKKRLGGWGFWIFLGLSLAIKGPAGPVVILGSVLLFLIWQGEGRRWRELIHPGGMIAALAINLGWVLPIVFLGDAESSQDLIVRQNIGRVLNPWRHLQPPWYYGINVWYDAFPSAIFFGSGAIFWWFRRKATGANGERVFGDDRGALRFLVAWVLFTIFFFSLYPPKRAQYLLPMYPAVTLFAVYFVHYLSAAGAKAGASARARWLHLAPGIILSGTLIFLAPALILWRVELADFVAQRLDSFDAEFAFELREANADFEYGNYVFGRAAQVSGTLIGLALGAGLVFLLRKKKEIAAFQLVVGSVFCAMTLFFATVIPPTFVDKEMKAFAADAERELTERPELIICMYGDDKPYFSIYGDYPVAYFDKDFDDEFQDYVRDIYGEGRPLMIVLETKREKKFKEEVWIETFERRELLLRGDVYAVYETP